MKTISTILVLQFAFSSIYSQTESRPIYNTGEGFFVKSGKIFDANGIEFTPYGTNSVHIWLNEVASKNALQNEISKTRMNTVRLVTAGESWTWNNQSDTPAKKKVLAESAINSFLIPMLELHDGTCLYEIDRSAYDGKMGLKQIVDHWLLPENIAMLNDLEEYLMLNIANEWGPDYNATNKTDYLTGYKDAITRLRNAGIENLLVIDAGGCGQDPNTLLNYADQLLAHDPQHNIVVSIHLYGLWRTKNKTFTNWTPPYVVEDIIPQLAALETPVIVGEFGWTGAGTSINFDPKILIQTCFENQLGWLFWAWYSNDNEPFFNTTTRPDLKYTSYQELSEAGKFLVGDIAYGSNFISKRATVFPEYVTAIEMSEPKIQLQPIPTSGMLLLSGEGIHNNYYEVLDTTGRICRRGVIATNEINISDLASGLYFLKILIDQKYELLKIIKSGR